MINDETTLSAGSDELKTTGQTRSLDALAWFIDLEIKMTEDEINQHHDEYNYANRKDVEQAGRSGLSFTHS